MEKSSLKHVLTLLDNYEIRGIDFQQAVDDVYDQLRQESHRHPSKNQISDQITQIIDAGMMRKLTRGYDVTPNATVFARSSIHSVLPQSMPPKSKRFEREEKAHPKRMCLFVL